jgi:hypothetical protein
LKINLAEGVGFEPTESLRLPAFHEIGIIGLLEPKQPTARTSYAGVGSNEINVHMFKPTGRVTEVCKISLLEDQITIEVEIPSNQGESTETRFFDWAVPAGTVKVGMTVALAFVE